MCPITMQTDINNATPNITATIIGVVTKSTIAMIIDSPNEKS